ncbi:MAG: hypothetical protein Hyperionvirus5_31 [Hyperionvirus sp.]|uniref:Uncharacterized protein n=1 Tax=Hyperionvirus sp. TaxID=2487770 RepID=A0A3G5A7L5_9VIRU|nr:MAG: hypothetical protein Hyperionvirus5_31 [Hyperionvirus sp.]
MSSPIVIKRVQYSFNTDPNTLVNVLTEFANHTPGVNIVAIVLRNIENDCTSVILVLGPPGENSPVINKIAEDILKENSIDYSRKKILEVLNIEVASATPGAYKQFYAALVKKCIEVDGSYIGEAEPNEIISTFFDVKSSQINKAKRILESV